MIEDEEYTPPLTRKKTADIKDIDLSPTSSNPYFATNTIKSASFHQLTVSNNNEYFVIEQPEKVIRRKRKFQKKNKPVTKQEGLGEFIRPESHLSLRVKNYQD